MAEYNRYDYRYPNDGRMAPESDYSAYPSSHRLLSTAPFLHHLPHTLRQESYYESRPSRPSEEEAYSMQTWHQTTSRRNGRSTWPAEEEADDRQKDALFRSTKGASKARRDLINTEIGQLRERLPLPEAARQRLSQLQVMSLTCCYIRKSNAFGKLFPAKEEAEDTVPEMSAAMTGFLLVCTKDGKLLYISENVTEFLGHSMVDMLTQGDSIYDITDKKDHPTIQKKIKFDENMDLGAQKEVSFFCKMNVSRNFRRQAGFGDYKVMHVKGHYLEPAMREHFGSEPVFMALCSPLITPEVKETVVQNNTCMFHTIHGLDMKVIEMAPNGEYHLGFEREEMAGKSWYEMLHPSDLQEAKDKHLQLIRSSHEMGCMLTVRMLTKTGDYVWVNIVMNIRQPFISDSGEPAVVCINHVIEANEAAEFKRQSQLYSSHLAPSPEYLASPMSGMPASHSITPVQVESRSMLVERYGALSNSLAASSTQLAEPQRVSSPSYLMPEAEAHDMSEIENSMNKPLLSQQEQKQIVRAGVLNRLKRKLSEYSNTTQCKPSKQAKVSGPKSPSNSYSSGSELDYTLHMNSFVTPIDSYIELPNFTEVDGGVVLTQLQQNTIPAVNLKQQQKVLETTDSFQLPPTPESLTSEGYGSMGSVSSEKSFGSEALSIDVHGDYAVVPEFLPSPEPSPVFLQSPIEKETFNVQKNIEASPPPLPVEMEEISMFSPTSNPIVPATVKTTPPKPKPYLPELDTSSVEQFFANVERLPVPIKEEPITSPAPSPTLTSDPITSDLPLECLQMSDDQLTKLVGTVTDVVLNSLMAGNEFLSDSLKEESESDFSVASPQDMAQVPCMGDLDLQDSSLFYELHQLSQLDTKPSYGDGYRPRAALDQTQ